MKDAAERYSPEMAEAFQPTDTDRPATKKSLAVLDFFADQNPIPMVTATVTSENVRIHGSTPSRTAIGLSIASAFDGVDLVLLERDGPLDESVRDNPHEREEQHPEDEPRQRKAGDPCAHELRREVVQQR